MERTLQRAIGMLVTLTVIAPLIAAHGQGGNKPWTQDLKEPSIQDGYQRKRLGKTIQTFWTQSEI